MMTLNQLGLNIAASRVFSDHHRYMPSDIDDIYEKARHLNIDIILTTEKDWTKTALMARSKDKMPLAYLAVELEFTTCEEQLKELIEKTLAVNSKKV